MFLHSHAENYPLRYEDGRISSQGTYPREICLIPLLKRVKLGQQVTGYPHTDTNNWWQVIPTKALPETGRGRVVRHQDVIQLLHVSTQTHLLTHDVASPLMPTNQEFTTLPKDDYSRYNETLFTLSIVDAHDGQPWKSKAGHFRLVHVPTKVALWTHPEALPDWAFNQQEINGNKNVNDRSTTWFVEDIVSDEREHHFRQRVVS